MQAQTVMCKTRCKIIPVFEHTKTCPKCGNEMTIQEVMDKDQSSYEWICKNCNYQDIIDESDFNYDERI